MRYSFCARRLGGRLASVGILTAMAVTGGLVAAPAQAATAEAAAAGPTEPTTTVPVVSPLLGYSPSDMGAMSQIETLVGATGLWKAGFTGRGVDVALIDTGVTKVQGLRSGNVVNGPDLSTDSANPDLRHLDSYGHGTHMASIIAGRDMPAVGPVYANSPGTYQGVAPDARIINVKVGATDGATDVSQVIAGINWVTQHAHDPGLNIRVINLSYGTSGVQSYQVDPLAYAVESAWRAGIAVVVAAGNDGTKHVDLANPALDPNVIAVGADDPMGTMNPSDDTIPEFSNRGTKTRHVDVIAPGTHVLGLRVPGSVVADANPAAAVGSRAIRGSGTSQATAVVSGLAALLLQARPDLTPAQLKWLLTYTATPITKGSVLNSGAGLVNVGTAAVASLLKIVPSAATATEGESYGTGTGSLEAARGAAHLTQGSSTLTGEKDIFGTAWNGSSWAPSAMAKNSWTGGRWRGNVWTGSGWSFNGDWSDATWSARSWTGMAWGDQDWSGRSWVADSWTGRSWVSSGWSGRTWVDSSWSSSNWS